MTLSQEILLIISNCYFKKTKIHFPGMLLAFMIRKQKEVYMRRKNIIEKISLIGLLVVFSLSASLPATAANVTKIAVASEGRTATATVGSAAARSLYFLIFDGSGKFIEAVSNPHQKARSGASSLVVNFLSQQGVSVFISQAFGDKMAGALKAKGIEHFKYKGSADDAVKRFLNSIESK